MPKQKNTSSVKPYTDAGGVAARKGFKYQDHIAAHFVITMLEDIQLGRVECETADDIVIFWKDGTIEHAEYIQVKTTDGDRKWTIKEATFRKTLKSPSSLFDKSLMCDAHGPTPRFRIVSMRDVSKELIDLKIDLPRRKNLSPYTSLGDKLNKKLKIKSAKNNLDFTYWATNCLWEVFGELEGIEARNENRIIRLLESYGEAATHRSIQLTYASLLSIVDKAASASKIKSPEAKVITRDKAIAWWNDRLNQIQSEKIGTAKPYRKPKDPFFSEFHNISNPATKRAMSSFDAAYEGIPKRWRSIDLASHLVNWLPEIVLRPSELVDADHLNLRPKLKHAINELKRHGPSDNKKTIAALLLHIILRHKFKTEPIGAKLFSRSASGVELFSSAHILHHNSRDELWLGDSIITTAKKYNDATKTILSHIEQVLASNLLKEEREIIITLREPQHLLPTTLDSVFNNNTSIDNLIDVLCIPILIGYDSSVLGKGYTKDYIQGLTNEVQSHYDTLHPSLPENLKEIKVHVFFIPIECIETLSNHFTGHLS